MLGTRRLQRSFLLDFSLIFVFDNITVIHIKAHNPKGCIGVNASAAFWGFSGAIIR
jgi:hypothetical protein